MCCCLQSLRELAHCIVSLKFQEISFSALDNKMETEADVLLPDVCSEEQFGSLTNCNVPLTLHHPAQQFEIRWLSSGL
jgi:hypothetical protein